MSRTSSRRPGIPGRIPSAMAHADAGCRSLTRLDFAQDEKRAQPTARSIAKNGTSGPDEMKNAPRRPGRSPRARGGGAVAPPAAQASLGRDAIEDLALHLLEA